jgi:DNA gyrase/topoisomerase IV subunit A
VEALVYSGDEGDVVIISNQGQVIRMPIKSVKRLGRDTQGVTLMRLNSGDKVSSMTILKKEKIDETKIEEKNIDENDSQKNKNIENNDKKKDQIANNKENNIKVKSNGFAKNKEGKMEKTKENSEKKDNSKNIHINKIEPKKIITDKQNFNPVVKAQTKKSEPKEFKPYIKSQKLRNQNIPNMQNDNFYVKHYQKFDENDTEDPKENNKEDGKNYWDGNLWKKK